jgi:hypothetical protein
MSAGLPPSTPSPVVVLVNAVLYYGCPVFQCATALGAIWCVAQLLVAPGNSGAWKVELGEGYATLTAPCILFAAMILLRSFPNRFLYFEALGIPMMRVVEYVLARHASASTYASASTNTFLVYMLISELVVALVRLGDSNLPPAHTYVCPVALDATHVLVLFQNLVTARPSSSSGLHAAMLASLLVVASLLPRALVRGGAALCRHAARFV